jgi:hypothetical protein
MKSIRNFEKLINDLKVLKVSNIYNENDIYNKFSSLITELSILKTSSAKPADPSLQRTKVFSILNSLKHLKSKVYNERLTETRFFINQNSEMFKISSFELMEHNFRENTHSNILKYLLDYCNTNNEGPKSLFLLLSETKGRKIKNLETKLNSKKYTIEREFHTGNGRIDLLIKDELNKLIIVIENKIFATVAEKDFDEDKNVTSTQLDLYKNYFLGDEKFKNWDKIFILLSYKDIEDFEDSHFELINYDTLFKILKQVNSKDNIVKDYLILLRSLTKNIYDKSWLIEQSNFIKSENGNLNLNVLETINNFTNGS